MRVQENNQNQERRVRGPNARRTRVSNWVLGCHTTPTQISSFERIDLYYFKEDTNVGSESSNCRVRSGRHCWNNQIASAIKGIKGKHCTIFPDREAVGRGKMKASSVAVAAVTVEEMDFPFIMLQPVSSDGRDSLLFKNSAIKFDPITDSQEILNATLCAASLRKRRGQSWRSTHYDPSRDCNRPPSVTMKEKTDHPSRKRTLHNEGIHPVPEEPERLTEGMESAPPSPPVQSPAEKQRIATPLYESSSPSRVSPLNQKQSSRFILPAKQTELWQQQSLASSPRAARKEVNTRRL